MFTYVYRGLATVSNVLHTEHDLVQRSDRVEFTQAQLQRKTVKVQGTVGPE